MAFSECVALFVKLPSCSNLYTAKHNFIPSYRWSERRRVELRSRKLSDIWLRRRSCTRWVAPGAPGAPGVAPGVPGGLHQVHQVGCTKCTRCCTRLDSKISSTEKYPGVTFDIGDETLANPSTCFCGSELCNDAAFSTATSKTLPTTLAFVFLVCAAVILI